MRIPYKKLSGAGNDFIIVDDRSRILPTPYEAFVPRLCHRATPWGGADGFIAITDAPDAQFAMHYFNADGSTGAMCGNGGRCAAQFALLSGIVAGPHIEFTVLNTRYTADVFPDSIRLSLPSPRCIELNRRMSLFDRDIRFHYVNVETPHAVIFLEDLDGLRPASLDALDIAKLGPPVRNHPTLQPEGANANFAEVRGENRVALRTYERGVEGETLACGTGSVSTAIVAHLIRGVQTPVHILTRSGEELIVDVVMSDNMVESLTLEGSARVVGEGTLEL
jgi:diaminopimelate epimerase